MRFLLWDFCAKAGYLRERLTLAGHEPAATLDDADLLLLDCDWRWAHPRPALIGAAAAAGVKVALYPHGGMPTVFVYDGLTDPNPAVGLRLEHGPGSIEAVHLLGLDLAQEAPGWLYSPTQPFTPVEKPTRVLFAPQHPNMETIGSGNGHDPAPALNQRVYRDLLTLGYELTVSIVGPAWLNGVWPHPNARLIQNPNMLFHETYRQILDADLVVGAGTVAAAAVACGKPVVSVGQAQGDYSDWVDGEYRHPAREALYDGLLRYPVDAADGDLDELIGRVCAGDEDAAGWRERFVGDDGSEEAVQLLNRLAETAERTGHERGRRPSLSPTSP